MVFFMVFQTKNWINFKEVKTLPHALSLELKDASKSNLPFENYTGYLFSHGSYSKFITFKIIPIWTLFNQFVGPPTTISPATNPTLIL